MVNINSQYNGNLKIYFNDSLLHIRNGHLDLTEQDNIKVISNYDEKYLYMIFDRYPDCLSNIPVEILLNTKFRLKILKYIANTTNDLLKTKSIYEINEHFGGILNVKIGQKLSFQDYVLEINNMFFVKIRNYLVKQYPEYADLIREKIDCTSNSVYLSGDLKTGIGSDIISTLFDNLIK